MIEMTSFLTNRDVRLFIGNEDNLQPDPVTGLTKISYEKDDQKIVISFSAMIRKNEFFLFELCRVKLQIASYFFCDAIFKMEKISFSAETREHAIIFDAVLVSA